MMKKILILCLFTFQFITIFANWIEFSDNYQKELFEHLSNGIEQTEVKFSLDGCEIESVNVNGKNFQRISYPNEGGFIEVGKPDLPRFSRLIAIPDQGEVIFEIVNMEEEIVSNINVFPRQIYQNESQSDNTEFVINEQFYKNGEIFPAHVVELGTPAILRGYRIVSVTINPFQYNPQTKELRIIKSVDVSVSTNGSEGENPKVRDGKTSRFFEPLYESVILNYESIKNRDVEYQQPCYIFIYADDDLLSLTGGYNLQDLIDWKRQKGFEVHAVCTDDIGSSNTLIKNYIQDAYDDWDNPPEFVCLVGDPSSSYNLPCYYYSSGSSDHNYSLMEGNDDLADIIVGRLSVDTGNDMKVIANKILNYEKEPYMGETEWYMDNLLIGDVTTYSGPSTKSTCKFIKETMLDYNENYTFNEYYSNGAGSFFQNSLNSGVSYFAYRGYLGMSGIPSYINNLSNGYMMPFVSCITCGTGGFDSESISEQFLEYGSATLPKAAIAAVGTATMGTKTCYNNIVTSGIFYGIFHDNIFTAGGSLVRGKLALFNSYSNSLGENTAQSFFYWNNLMGDPGLELWTGIPEEMNIEYDNEVALGTNYLEVTVYNSSGFPLENAWVTALMGDDVIFATGFADIEGRVFLPIEANTIGEVALTVTYHNCIPHLGSFDIVQEDVFVNVFEINIDDDDLGTSSGNGDGLINPGESIELGVSLKNFGLSTANLVSAVITSESDCISITDDSEDYGDIPAGSSVFSDDDFDFSVNTDVLGGTEIILDILIEDEDQEQWSDRICLYVDGPYLYADDYSVIDGNNSILEPGETANLEVTLSNIGTVSVYDLSGTLSCSDNRITIEDNEGYFNNVSAGGQASNNTDRFTISASESIIPGSQISFNLQLYNTLGYDQTVSFVMEIGIVSVTDPLGPDAYGYYCYDDEDEFFEDIEYDWIEIDPDLGYYDGTIINLYDPGQTGDLEVIDLPPSFTFQFYGIQYDEITVCSNGFITPGVTENFEFMNWHIPGPQAPAPLIAAFWDDLIITYNTNVCYYYHPEEHYFVIEWNNTTNQHSNDEETFEIILYDSNFYPTTTNDSKIKFQYKEINNNDQGTYTYHGLFSTVGIVDHTNSIGIEYTCNNEYPTAAKPLEDEMAILITPYPIPAEGPYVYISNYEIHAGGNNTIEYGETVYLDITLINIGHDTATNVNMELFIDDEYITLIDGNEFFGTIASDGSSTVNNAYVFEVSEDVPDNHYIQFIANIISDEITWERYINLIAYAPPDLEVNVTSFNIEMGQDEIHHETLELTNTVTGSGALNYTIRVEEPTNRTRDLTGSYVECNVGTFEPGESVTWIFTAFNGSEDNEWVTDVNIHFPYGVTVNSASDFVGGSGGPLAYDETTGENVLINWHGSTGLGYGYLHAFQTAVAEVSVDITSIFSGNVVLSYEMIGDEYGEEPHIVEGTITLHYPLGWISIYPPVGIITGGETDEIDVTFDTGELDPGIHECNIIINDGSDYETVIPVTLNVTSSESDDNIIPLTTKLNGNYPNPFNPANAGSGRSTTTTIDFSLKEPCNVQLDIYNIKGEKVVTLIDNLLNAAYHSVIWAGKDQNGKSVSSGVYFYKLKAGKYTSIKKMLLMK